MKKILFILGTRPECIKIAPLYLAMKEHMKNLEIKVCSTGQHKEMLDQVFDFFNFKPDYSLNIMKPNQTLAGISEAVMSGVDNVLGEYDPDLVIIQGDTTTAFIGALVAFYKNIKVAHLEAGLRTGDMYSPFPEEANRVFISKITNLHFAPTIVARKNLLSEHIDKDCIFKVGNTVTDAILLASKIINNDKLIAKKFKDIDLSKKVILVTAHRRENLGANMDNIATAIKSLAIERDDVEIVFPVHLNPRVSDVIYSRLDNIKNIHLLKPLDYAEMVWIMNRSYFVLTDSGGIQEEAPTLGKPVLVMRESTERPEGVSAGTAMLVGTDRDAIYNESINLLDNVDGLYDRMSHAINPYGDGNCSSRIIKCLSDFML